MGGVQEPVFCLHMQKVNEGDGISGIHIWIKAALQMLNFTKFYICSAENSGALQVRSGHKRVFSRT